VRWLHAGGYLAGNPGDGQRGNARFAGIIPALTVDAPVPAADKRQIALLAAGFLTSIRCDD
jgi:hypothetical protein